MAENPDRRSVGHAQPKVGQLRFVERMVELDGVERVVRILQVYEWSETDLALNWYDVPLEVE